MRLGRRLFVVPLMWLAGCAEVPNAAPDETGRKGLLSSAVETPLTAARVQKKAKPLVRATLAAGNVAVVPPEGYCIDPKSRRGSAKRGFAALASCRILTGGQVGSHVEPVLMTVTVGPRGQSEDLPSPEMLAEARQAPLISGSRTPDAVYVHLARGGATALPGGDRRHWRAAFVLNGRLVGAALYAPAGSFMAGPGGADLLLRLKTRMVAETAKPGGDDGLPGAKRPVRKRGLFAGLKPR